MTASNHDPVEESKDDNTLHEDVHDFDIPLSISDDDIARDLFGSDDDELDDALLQTQVAPVPTQTDTDSDTESLPSVPDNRTQVSFRSASQLLVSFSMMDSPLKNTNQSVKLPLLMLLRTRYPGKY